jgi:cyclomaltodextrinase
LYHVGGGSMREGQFHSPTGWNQTDVSNVCDGAAPGLPGKFLDDRARFVARRADWRYGHTLYQIFVDRFVPSRRLDAKRKHYAPPRVLRPWSDDPGHGKFLDDVRNHEGELQFWGGDFDSLTTKLDYLQELGVDMVYLNPVFEAFTNHKYDGMDYFAIDPQYGTKNELKELADDLHARGMRLMLDGVFNHMGRRAPAFQRALASETAPERHWFYFGEEHKNGYRGWRNVANLPEINLENPAVRAMAIEGDDSAVVHYLRDVGIDGWRLDVGPDVGFEYLATITRESHRVRPDSVVIGECWNYPEEWLHAMDGTMNMHARAVLLAMIEGRMSVNHTARAFDRMIADCGTEGLLRSHLVLDNHDLPRIATVLKTRGEQVVARILQFTLAGCPVVYYGSEFGMLGGADPTNRGPMRWELESDDNEELQLVRTLIRLRKENDALRIGDIRMLETERLFAFLRRTDHARESILVIANPSDKAVTEFIPVRDSRWMDAAPVRCLLSGARLTLHCGIVEASVPPHSVQVFRTEDRGSSAGYSMFKRVP